MIKYITQFDKARVPYDSTPEQQCFSIVTTDLELIRYKGNNTTQTPTSIRGYPTWNVGPFNTPFRLELIYDEP